MSKITNKFEESMDSAIGQLSSGKSLGLLCILLAGIVGGIRQADYDLFARVAVGRLIVRDGTIPLQDVFAYTPVKSNWYDHEWLSGLIFYLVSQLGGDTFLILFSILLAAGTTALLAYAQRERSDAALISTLWLAICLLPSTFIWNGVVRSHSFTFLVFAYLLFATERLVQTQRTLPLLFLPALMVFLVNAHGGFVAVLGVFGVFALVKFVREQAFRRTLLVVSILVLLAPLCNPYGLEFLSFIFSAVTKSRPLIVEWEALKWFQVENILFWLVAAVMAWATASKRTKLELSEIAILLVTFLAAIKVQRFVPFFLFSASVYGLPAFEALIGELKLRAPRLSVMLRRSLMMCSLIGCFVSAVLLIDILFISRPGLRYDKFPVKAMQWLRENHPGGRLMVHFNEGSYALWRGYPNFLISVDGRYEEVYPDETVEAVLQCYRESAPCPALKDKRYTPDLMLLCNMSTFPSKLSLSKDWTKIYSDNKCEIRSFKSPNPETIGSPLATVESVWEPLF